MVKNITLSLSNNLANQMATFPEVNWSQVDCTCIQRYITQRRNPNITSLLEKLRNENGQDYMKGRRWAEAIAHTLGYTQLTVLLKTYQNIFTNTNHIRRRNPLGTPANLYQPPTTSWKTSFEGSTSLLMPPMPTSKAFANVS